MPLSHSKNLTLNVSSFKKLGYKETVQMNTLFLHSLGTHRLGLAVRLGTNNGFSSKMKVNAKSNDITVLKQEYGN
jgi:hypothetical protein